MDSLMGRLGDEVSMLAHIEACTGIRHTRYERAPRRLPSRTKWREIRWPTWSSETPHRHGKTPKARMAL
jgi:hypothetical protein